MSANLITYTKKKCMDLWFIPRENAEGVINVKGVPSILELFRSIDPGKDEDSQPYLLGRISLQG